MWWRNSNFQKVFFITGKAHTADEAYRLLQELKEDRSVPIAEFEASMKRQKAKQLRAEAALKYYSNILKDNGLDAEEEATRLEAEADLLEIQAHAEQAKNCYEEAVRELDFINKMIEDLQPFRRYASLPDHKAYQACQLDEWREKLKFQIENQIATRGCIDSELLGVIRLHPQCETELMPHMNNLQVALKSGKGIPLGGKNDSVSKHLVPALAAINKMLT